MKFNASQNDTSKFGYVANILPNDILGHHRVTDTVQHVSSDPLNVIHIFKRYFKTPVVQGQLGNGRAELKLSQTH